MSNQETKALLYKVIFGTDTKAGKNFDIALIILILLSVFCVILDSINIVSQEYESLLHTAEWFFTLLFTLEYAVRLYCSPSVKRYAGSFYGIVDVLAFIPSYLALFISSANFLIVIRLLRVLRIFRILKLLQYMSDSQLLLRSLILSSRKIFIFFFTVLVIVTLIGSLMYLVEGPEHGFTSIPKSIYWAIVTVTTVGYGDIIPQTALGQAISAFAMLTGYAILAVPTGILSAELIGEMQREKNQKTCLGCNRSGHEKDAKFCRFCGNNLNSTKQNND